MREITVSIKTIVVLVALLVMVYGIYEYVNFRKTMNTNIELIAKVVNAGVERDKSTENYIANQRYMNDVVITMLKKIDEPLLKQTITEVRSEIDKIQRSGNTPADETSVKASTDGEAKKPPEGGAKGRVTAK